eukprot:3447269-Pyramimonas_sp.AAC.1
MALAQVTRLPECSAKPAGWGPDPEVKHAASGARGAGVSEMVLMLSARVDDLNDLEIVWRAEDVDQLISHLEN